MYTYGEVNLELNRKTGRWTANGDEQPPRPLSVLCTDLDFTETGLRATFSHDEFGELLAEFNPSLDSTVCEALEQHKSFCLGVRRDRQSKLFSATAWEQLEQPALTALAV